MDSERRRKLLERFSKSRKDRALEALDRADPNKVATEQVELEEK